VAGLQAAFEQCGGGGLDGELSRLGSAGDPLGGHLQQLGVIVGERAIIEPADMQNADDVLPVQQRDAEHLPDALLPQERIRNGGRIHPIQHDRALALRDAAGESSADRDPDTLPDFLFQPTCGPRNQLVGTAIAQQDCRGIRIEHRANSVKQFGKQILDLEPGQGRVGDCKQIAQLLRPGTRHRSASLGPSRRPRYRTPSPGE